MQESQRIRCHCTNCMYNNNGLCNYRGNLVIDADGECETKDERGRAKFRG